MQIYLQITFFIERNLINFSLFDFIKKFCYNINIKNKDKMFMKRSIPELVRMLNHYTDMYDQGYPEISDKQWDDLYFELVQMEKEAGYAFRGKCASGRSRDSGRKGIFECG